MNERNDRLREERARKVFEVFNREHANKYRIIKRIQTEGCFSCIFEIEDNRHTPLIMKVVDSYILDVNISPSLVIKYTTSEIESMIRCRDSEYVMDLIEYFDCEIGNANDEHIFILIMPKMEVSTQYFQDRNYDFNEIIRMGMDICKALDFCHSHKILHRDIKPQNIFYSHTLKHFVLSDFGISRTIFDKNLAVTKIGSYLAPEILAQRNLNGRFNSDIFSLGISILYLQGELSLDDDYISYKFNQLSADTRDIILRAIDGDPAKRYQTAREFYDALNCIKQSSVKAGNNTAGKIMSCIEAFDAHDYNKAYQIAKDGHERGDDKMTCIFAYLSACAGNIDNAMKVLENPVRKGYTVAVGLYGMLGHMLALKTTNKPDEDMIKLIFMTAKNGFSVSQYLIGRWLMDGEFGIHQDIAAGLDFLFESSKRGFPPSMNYLRKALVRHEDKIFSAVTLKKILDIQLKGYSKEKYPNDVLRAIARS